MRCPACEQENPQGARFCAFCGTPLGARAPVAAGEERRVVTVLFADLAGFTTLAESMDPEDLRSVVGRFYAAVAAEVQRFGGTVEKYVGDAALAIFGLPEVHEDDAERAVRAALAIQSALVRLNEDLAREGRPELGMRVGINTGEVVANPHGGALGEFHLAADAINVAARLQQHGQAGWILIGPRTERLVRGIAETEAIGPVALKGKEQPVPAWRVRGLLAERAQRGIPGREAPLIGRGDEMDLLLRLYDRVVRERRTHLVTVLGNPGVGKSRLVGEYTALLRGLPESPVVRKGRCLPYGERPFSAAGDIVRQDAHIMDGDPPDAAREKLASAVGRAVPADVERVAAALGFLIGLVFPDAPIAGYDPKSAREEAFLGWRRYLAGRAGTQPLLLVIEDLHWGDEGLLDLLEHAATRLAEVPVMLCCLARPELLERRPTWGGGARNATTINLEPLTDSESRALVAALLAVDDLSEPARTAIVGKAEGNPFFVEEIVRMLMEQGGIVEDAGRWRARPGLDAIPLPDTVQGVLAARLDGLPAEEKRVLQYAAVVGRTFWLAPVRALVGDGVEHAGVLDALEQHELIRERPVSTLAGDREFIFKHALTREVAYGTLPRAVRGPAHAAVARWIEETAPGRVDEVVDVLAYHWGSAGDVPRAVDYLLRAADRARSLFANRRAVDAYTQALTMGAAILHEVRAADLRRRRGEALQVLGEYDTAREDFQAALAAARASGDRAGEARLLYEIARLHHRRRDRPFEEIIAAYEEARRLAVEVGDRRTEGVILTDIAAAHWDVGKLAEGARLGADALAILRETGDHAALAGVMNFLTMSSMRAADLAGGLRWAEEALVEARAAGDRSREATALSYAGMLQQMGGRLEEALTTLVQAERVADEIGDRRRLMWIDAFRGFIHLARGEYDKALRTHVAMYDAARALGFQFGATKAFVGLDYLLLGDLDKALEFVERAMQAGLDDYDAAALTGMAGMALVEVGRTAEGHQQLLMALDIITRNPAMDDVIFGAPWMAHSLADVGDYANAIRLADLVLQLVPADWMAEARSVAHTVRGLAALAEGRVEDADAELTRGAEAVRDTPYLPAALQAYLALVRLRASQGRVAEARAAFTQAEALLQRIADQIEDAALRTGFLTAGPLARHVEEARQGLRAGTGMPQA